MSDISCTNKRVEDLISELGWESRMGGLAFDDEGRERTALLIPTGRYSMARPFPGPFYAAERWLRRHRAELQKAIIEGFDYGSKRDRYQRGREAEFVNDLAPFLATICQEPFPVDPVLVAVILLRLGIEEFCRGYHTGDKQRLWSLSDALGIDSYQAEEYALAGGELLFEGKWEAAIPFFEKALARDAFNRRAMNNLAYIYATYFPEQQKKKGLEYAVRVLNNTPKGDPWDVAVLDTAGWSFYRHKHDIVKAEKLLREALSLTAPGSDGFISITYHLMCVVNETGNQEDVKKIWLTIRDIPPGTTQDQNSHKSAYKLVARYGNERSDPVS